MLVLSLHRTHPKLALSRHIQNEFSRYIDDETYRIGSELKSRARFDWKWSQICMPKSGWHRLCIRRSKFCVNINTKETRKMVVFRRFFPSHSVSWVCRLVSIFIQCHLESIFNEHLSLSTLNIQVLNQLRLITYQANMDKFLLHVMDIRHKNGISNAIFSILVSQYW